MINRAGHDAESLRTLRDAALEQALDHCSRSCLDKCLPILPAEDTHFVWLRLYAASERLKMAVREGGVAEAILEIGSNLLGCEEMAILELHWPFRLGFLAGAGITPGHEQNLAANGEAIAAAIAEDQVTMVQRDRPYGQLWRTLGITAFVPIWHERRPRGAIVFFRLLSQRSGFDSSDRELMLLLSIFSGPLLFDA